MASKLAEAKSKVVELSTKALAIAEDTTKSFAEQKEALDPLEADIKKWTDEVQELTQLDEKRKSFQSNVTGHGGSLDDAAAEVRSAAVAKSIGQQFIESAGYKGLIEGGLKGNWSSGDIEVKDALSEAGDGLALVNNPTVLPGIVDQRFKTLTVADLFPNGTTDSPLIRYLVETLAENGAKETKEGALKPASRLKFDKKDEVLHKIATFLPITDEMLEDWAQARSYIDARLALFVKLAEEDALLNSTGADGTLTGILQRTGLAATIVKGTAPSVAGDNAMDAIYRQITVIRTTQFLEPDAVAIDPLGWQGITLSKNSQGAYYANGPFVGAQPETLWGKKVAVTPSMAAGESLVGAFAQGGQIFRKGGLTVEASNSHADYFQRNLTALRAEERLALAIYRPGAFGKVTGLNA